MNLLFLGGGYRLGIDPYYLLLVLPAMLVAMWARARVSSTFRRYGGVSAGGMTGYDAAKRILADNGLADVAIRPVGGNLTDCYDPRAREIRLSGAVMGADSVAAVGVAAHEAGHAVQYADRYFPIRIRAAMVPVTNIGSALSFPLILFGVFAGVSILVYAGIALFSLVTAFQLVTLPVEFNASRRALAALGRSGALTEQQLFGARKVLRAAALTYVAALLVSFMNLLRLLLLFGRRNSR